ncbi:hypothetical protein H2198_002673 [Neophaeococcomyces mojaviensis]|uniref:Uncharacterized protein n=1 Tax=Neophaeococcomyces mojaviensis TaxID=3383035 RepID=A0ACC3ADB6_9EURO|nr:hypothetical protein H2198_002673 [Knufia sp. JES_112]
MATATPEQPQDGDGQFPLAAQIPLESFTLPPFPAEASHLRSLTLTSDINLNDYQSKHLRPGTFEPSTTLPQSITHLTLELFSLGFPAPFLSTLAASLPNLQSLTLFSCLIDGLDEASRKDAIALFRTVAPTLRELHLIDTFARVGFWASAAAVLSSSTASTSGLKVLTVSTTYRGHHESDFLNRVSGDEWPALITPSLVGLSLNFESPPPAENEDAVTRMQPEDGDEEGLLKAGDGILPFASDGRPSVALRKRFEALSAGESASGAGAREKRELLNLRVLNLSMYSLRAVEVGEAVYAAAKGQGTTEGGGLVDLTVSVMLEEGWFGTLVEGLGRSGVGESLEGIEIVGVPTSKLSNENEDLDAEKLLVQSEATVQKLAKVCGKLNRFEMSVLKSRKIGSVVWTKKEDEKWVMERQRQPTA